MVLIDPVWPFAPQACRDFLTLAQAHSKRWQKALQAEREQRVRLEETLEQLAKQHNHLERAFRGAAQANATADNKSKMCDSLECRSYFRPVHNHSDHVESELSCKSKVKRFEKSFYGIHDLSVWESLYRKSRLPCSCSDVSNRQIKDDR